MIVKFAIPCVISLVVNALYNIVDQIFIGWGVGYLGNGATNIVFPITIIALAFAVLIGDGGAAYISLKLGEGDKESAKRGVGNVIVMVTVVGILIMVVFLTALDPILTLFGSTDILRPYALDYGYAEYYSAELSQKVKRGMKETRLKDNFTGGTIIYGYKVENHKVTIDEEKAEVVRYIYEQYAMGVYVKDIISALTEKGIFNKGKPFARNTIYNILKNEKYFGICRHNDEVFDNIYPAIVPKEVYEKVRQKTDTNKYGKRSVEVVYMLRNKMICGYCGKPISAETGTSKGGKKIRYYKCLGRKHNNGCTKSMVRKELLEDFVVSNIVKLLSEKEVKDKMISSLMRMQEELITDNADLQRLTKKRKTTETQITNIMTAIENGGTSATAMKRLRELELKAAELEKAIAIQKAKTADRFTEEEMRAYYEQALTLEPQMLINTLVKQITLYDDKIIIQYNSPVKAGPDESRDFSFYEKQLKMPYVRQNKKDLQYRKFTIVLSV